MGKTWMMIRRKPSIFWLLAFTLLFSCTPNRIPTVSPSPSPEMAITLSPTPGDVFQVDAWVSDPAPARDSLVILSGSLIKNHIYLGGIMMRAYWSDTEQPRGSPNCYVMVLYKRGKCVIDASKFPPGTFVPIKITFEYQGMQFSVQTGFTPR